MGTRLNNSLVFSENIEQLVRSTNMTYIDAVLHYFEENKLQKIDVIGNGQTVFLAQNDEKENNSSVSRC